VDHEQRSADRDKRGGESWIDRLHLGLLLSVQSLGQFGGVVFEVALDPR
jgi:hypothetical protein